MTEPMESGDDLDEQVAAFAAELDRTGVPGIDPRTTDRLLALAAERILHLPPGDEQRRAAAAGNPLVTWQQEADGRVVGYWPEGEVLVWMAPEVYRAIVAHDDEQLHYLMDLAGEVRVEVMPRRADVERDAVALLRAWVAEDHAGTEALVQGRDPLPLLMVLADNLVDVALRSYGPTRFERALAAWRPGLRLSDLLEDTV